jgi:nucleotide-binding universal stress UspA family protein
MNTERFRRILLATDGSREAEAAMSSAGSFALACGAQVKVLHVWNLEVHHREGVWDVEMYPEAEALIGDAVRRLRALGVDASGEIRRSDPAHIADAIARSAEDFDADLVVVGSRGLSDWQSLLHHSVSHQLLGAVDSPVLVVRGTGTPVVHQAQKVLLAIAGPDDLELTAHAALAAAAAPGSKIVVLHVAMAFVGAQGFACVETDAEIQATLDRAVEVLHEAGVACETVVAEPASVAQVVAEMAVREQADVIVIGSSRMGDVASIVLGSVTHQLLRTATTPVLVAERARR